MSTPPIQGVRMPAAPSHRRVRGYPVGDEVAQMTRVVLFARDAVGEREVEGVIAGVEFPAPSGAFRRLPVDLRSKLLGAAEEPEVVMEDLLASPVEFQEVVVEAGIDLLHVAGKEVGDSLRAPPCGVDFERCGGQARKGAIRQARSSPTDLSPPMLQAVIQRAFPRRRVLCFFCHKPMSISEVPISCFAHQSRWPPREGKPCTLWFGHGNDPAPLWFPSLRAKSPCAGWYLRHGCASAIIKVAQ